MLSRRAWALAALLLMGSSPAFAGIDWNDKAVQWHGYAEGAAIAKRENKPMLLIVYADWCGVCKQYATMFNDPKVLAASRKVVLVRLNQDRDKKDLLKYSLDGKYVPRTFILNKDLVIQPSPYKRDDYGFFLPPQSNELLVDIMNTMKP